MTVQSDIVQDIVRDIIANLTDRRGLRQAFEECDNDIQREIFDCWCDIASNHLQSTSPASTTKPKLIFKIQSENGLFSSGGSTPNFTTKGKVWTGKGGISNHLQILDSRGRSIYRTNKAKVIAYELSETVVGESMSVDDWVGSLMDKKLKREQLAQAAQKAAEKERRRLQYAQLKKEFE